MAPNNKDRQFIVNRPEGEKVGLKVRFESQKGAMS